MNNLNKIHIVTSKNRASNPDLKLTQDLLESAYFPPDCPIEIKIYNGKIVIRPIILTLTH